MADQPETQGWRRLVKAVKALFASAAASLDPIQKAAALPEIKAAAGYWRVLLASGLIVTPRPLDTRVILKEPLSPAELDSFEAALAMEFARAKVYCSDANLFNPRGLEIWLNLHCAARDAGFEAKINSFGYMTRMRIMPDSVDHEVGEMTDYRKGNWKNVWRPASAA
jgi:hypothetical protein